MWTGCAHDVTLTALPTGEQVLIRLGWRQPPAKPDQPVLVYDSELNRMVTAPPEETQADLLVLANEHVGAVTTLARSYTRGKGFWKESSCMADIKEVIVSAACRSLSNPSQAKRLQAGSMSATPGVFAGWSLLEATILNRYRCRQG